MTLGWAAVSQDTNPSTSPDRKRKIDTSDFMKMERNGKPGGVKILTLHRFERELVFGIDKEFLKADSGEADE